MKYDYQIKNNDTIFPFFKVNLDVDNIKVAVITRNTRGTQKVKVLVWGKDYQIKKTRIKNQVDILLLTHLSKGGILRIVEE